MDHKQHPFYTKLIAEALNSIKQISNHKGTGLLSARTQSERARANHSNNNGKRKLKMLRLTLRTHCIILLHYNDKFFLYLLPNMR